ncbi:UNVERIFIED_CONTAM: hypothetical protein Sangu_1330900 [Sesamum angustifolium]|uniref:Polymerase nucleotidyl transferase domain-containing protein n=1 Tax=Sesamum angustifolium TaxID=2727405 RepID=A0AAW2N4G2_9LAMI
MGDLPGGGAAAELRPVASHSTPFPEPNPLEIRGQNWATADRAAREIIRKVQPTSVSEERRREVVDYIQRLIRNCLGIEVFPYGSVPLKTYLPDGDIDLTAFGVTNDEDALADDMKSVLEEEERNRAPEFIVKDVQLIRAEVKLVKCIVQDIVVDVSFNQIGGLCTLCFLEQVDRLIGKDHLFKRSIILIKAWCYYESRILGAHHGLISTYALETLVLYIFHLFHSALDGPLAVLYKFLDYFSKFDWETYCISLNGPVRLSSLPSIVAEMPEDSDRDYLLSSDFLSSCIGMFSVPSRGGDKNSRGFQRKHLNIVDPLKEINNLGRSVSKGNFYRIRSAFSYGARKLARILTQPEDSVATELHKFFSNTMARHGGGQRPDVQDFDPSVICNRPISAMPVPEAGLSKTDNLNEYIDEHAGDFQPSSGKFSQDLLKGTERKSDVANGEPYSSLVLKHPTSLLERDQPSEPNALGSRFHGDSNDLATSSLGELTISAGSSTRQTPVMKESVTAVAKPYHAPHLYFSKSKSMRDRDPDSDKQDNCEKSTSSMVSSGSDEGRDAAVRSMDENQFVDKDEAVASSKPKDVFPAPKSLSFSGDQNHMDSDHGSTRTSETPEALNSSDLTGDYESYLHCLQYGRWCYEYGLTIHSLHMPHLPTAPYQSTNSPWDGLLPHSHFKQNGFSHRHHNGFHPSQAMYTMQPLLVPGVPFGWEEMPKPKGTGTYFPNMSQSPQGYRSSSMKARNHAPPRSPRTNGRSMIFREPNMLDRSSHESSQPQVRVEKSAMVSSSGSYPSFSPRGNGYPSANGSLIQPEGVVEFELVGHASGTSESEKNRKQRSVSSSPKTFSGTQKSRPALSREQDRISLKHLKDEDDFPPLSV